MKQISIKHTIDHKPQANDFALIEKESAKVGPGCVKIRVVYLSLDPYIGSRLRGRHMGEAAPKPMDEAIPGAVVGQIIESRDASLKTGEWVHSMEGSWAEYVTIEASHCRKINPDLAPIRAHIGVLGMPGLTAWAGVTQLAKVKHDDIFLVNAAAGPVGGTAGQLARLHGANRVVGIAGGPEKCALVTKTYGFDACIDYKQEGWQEELSKALPEGCSVFYENVSAEMAMISLSNAQLYARGVLCGLADAYHSKERSEHPLNAGFIMGKRAQIHGLVVYDFYPRWDEYVEATAGWIREEKLKFAEDAVEGLENAPHLFEKLMNGQNIGKCVVNVSPETP